MKKDGNFRTWNYKVKFMHAMGGILNILDPDEERIQKLESNQKKKSEGSTEWQKDGKCRRLIKTVR